MRNCSRARENCYGHLFGVDLVFYACWQKGQGHIALVALAGLGADRIALPDVQALGGVHDAMVIEVEQMPRQCVNACLQQL
jgi:hypothetical protein